MISRLKLRSAFVYEELDGESSTWIHATAWMRGQRQDQVALTGSFGLLGLERCPVSKLFWQILKARVERMLNCIPVLCDIQGDIVTFCLGKDTEL